MSGCPPLTNMVTEWRLRFFGHNARSASDEDHHRVVAAAIHKLALDWKRTPERPNHMWLRATKSDLRPLNIDLSYTWKTAATRDHRHAIVDTVTVKKRERQTDWFQTATDNINTASTANMDQVEELTTGGTWTQPASISWRTWARRFISRTSYSVESRCWPLVIGFTNRLQNSLRVPSRLGFTKLTMQWSAALHTHSLSGSICFPLCIVVRFLCELLMYIFILCFMSWSSCMKFSTVLCYNINKLTY